MQEDGNEQAMGVVRRRMVIHRAVILYNVKSILCDTVPYDPLNQMSVCLSRLTHPKLSIPS